MGISICLGLFLRINYVNTKPYYWSDEMHSYIASRGIIEDTQAPTLSEPTESSEVYDYITKQRGVGILEMIRQIRKHDPNHPPLFEVISFLLLRIVSSSPIILRILSVAISILTLPLVYWCARKLFDSKSAGYIAISLYAVSPFYIVYATEARPYSLFSFAVFLSAFAIVTALKHSNWYNWLWYTATIIIGLYSHLLFSLVIASYAAYVFFAKRPILSKLNIKFALYTTLALVVAIPLAFVPPSAVVGMSWQYENLSIFKTIMGLAHKWTVSLVDLWVLYPLTASNYPNIPFNENNPTLSVITVATALAVGLIIVCIIAYSLYFLWKTKKKNFLLPIALVLVPEITLLALYLFFGNMSITRPRFAVPMYAGIILAVAYLFAHKIDNSNKSGQRMWYLLLITIIISSAFTSTIGSRAGSWWNKTPKDLRTYDFISQAENPLLLFADKGETFTFSTAIPNKAHFAVAKDPLNEIPSGFSEVLLVYTNTVAVSDWIAAWEEKFVLSKCCVGCSCYKIEKER